MNWNMTPEITINVNKELEELNKKIDTLQNSLKETQDKLKKVSDKSYTGKWSAVKKVKVK
nr:hypothetical protein [uncultured Mogibacterium sp.]